MIRPAALAGAALCLCFLAGCGSSAEPGLASEIDVSSTEAFSGRVAVSEFDASPDRVVGSGELPAILAVGTRAAMYVPGGDVVSRGEFAAAFAASRGGRYFVVGEDGVVEYPAGDGAFLSADEWDRLRESLDAAATVAFCERLFERAEVTEAVLRGNEWPRDVEAFSALIRDYYRDFEDLVAESGDAVAFWLESGSFGSERFYFGEFGSVIHEAVHEASATRSGVFAGRGCADGGWWEVRWSRVPSRMWFLRPRTFDWVELPVGGLPGVAVESAPGDVRDGALWARYVDAPTGVRRSGLSGVLQELQATVAEVRLDVVAVSLGHMYYYLPTGTVDQYYFWRGVLLASLAEWEAECPGRVRGLPAGVREYVVSLLDYADAQLGFYPDRALASSYGRACLEWAASNEWVLESLAP